MRVGSFLVALAFGLVTSAGLVIVTTRDARA
jgi:hypothetical protein